MRLVWVPTLAAAGVLFANALFGTCAWAEPSAANGRMLFAAVGCYSCHGYEGQGGAAGPRIAPDPLPYDGLAAFVRTTSREMPPYSEKILSDANLADIYAYLQSIPRPPDVKSVPLLNQ